jgi:hypothetical protein
MLKLTPPSDLAKSVFITCISKVKNAARKIQLANCIPLIEAAAADYELKSKTIDFHLVKQQTDVGGVSIVEMEKVYKFRMAGSNSPPGRPYYEKYLKISSRCPYCAHREVSQLDHYLAQSLHPALVVTPLNLIPSCGDCNKIKLAVNPTNANDQLLHPYFDNVQSDPWLTATVIHTSPAVLQYDIIPPATWDAKLTARVRHHFKTFDLAKLYASQAVDELNNISYGLVQIFATEGEIGVRQHLQRQADSRSMVRVNSWQTAMYAAIAQSDWFCQGGFK